MKKKMNKPATVEEENKRRYTLRKIILSVGTPFIIVVMLAAAVTVNSILTTLSAQKMFSYQGSFEEQNQATKLINKSAYTSTFLEGYKAKYNYATSIAEHSPLNMLNIYTTEVIPYSPPQFGCYPALNGLYYAERNGDQRKSENNLAEAELYYNYAQYFLQAAEAYGCSSSSSSNSDGQNGGGSSGSDNGEPQSGDKSEKNQKEIQGKRDELDDKREDVREAQGKENNKRQNNGDKPSEEQKEQNQKNTDNSEKRQNDTKNIRDADKNKERPSESTTPW